MKTECYDCSSKKLKINKTDFRCLDCGGLYVNERNNFNIERSENDK